MKHERQALVTSALMGGAALYVLAAATRSLMVCLDAPAKSERDFLQHQRK